eukprot:scaffold40835_cov191-Amphora_coffeaeformis.AAC.2
MERGCETNRAEAFNENVGGGTRSQHHKYIVPGNNGREELSKYKTSPLSLTWNEQYQYESGSQPTLAGATRRQHPSNQIS